MRPELFGDSYDFVKRDLIHWLAPAEEWATHPMYFDEEPEPDFVAIHAAFLGIAVAEGNIADRDSVIAVGEHCPQHLLLDPDTGLWASTKRPNGGWDKHIRIGELAQIAQAPLRQDKLTLVFDQSYSRTGDKERRVLAWNKLERLRERRIYGVAYVSHAVFIWVSANTDTLTRATQWLLNCSHLPIHRFVGYGI